MDIYIVQTHTNISVCFFYVFSVSGEMMKYIGVDIDGSLEQYLFNKDKDTTKQVEGDELFVNEPSSSTISSSSRAPPSTSNHLFQLCLQRRVCLLLVHGILHLQGHDHESYGGKNTRADEMYELMRKEEERVIAGLYAENVL